MCGIAGLLSDRPIDPALVETMTGRLLHRGPDGHGLWTATSGRIALGHRRLAVIDLSEAGAQPMRSPEGQLVISFNGEIYNHLALRRRLEQEEAAPPGGWRGSSDTETLLAAITAWGLAAALERAVGMFALALWDDRAQRLALARDRFGEKPLYYGWLGGGFAFASELKAIRALPALASRIAPAALAAFLARGYVPAPLSIYADIFKLEPGSILTVSPEGSRHPPAAATETLAAADGITLTRFYDHTALIRTGLDHPPDSPEDAADRVEQALGAAVERQMLADVPVGLFLSGGIDSSLLVALAQEKSARPVQSFTIGFETPGYDEAGHARAIARHLGTEHHERCLSPRDALDLIPRLPAVYDEPFADSSQLPLMLLSRFARARVTVALSGDGADELFGGYQRHAALAGLWRRMERLPFPARRALLGALARVPGRTWGRLPSSAGPRPPYFGERVRRGLAAMAQARGFGGLVNAFLDDWAGTGLPPPCGGFAVNPSADAALVRADPRLALMALDAVGYLPGDILCKVDRAAMAASLETRAPYLDADVAAIAVRIPADWNIRDGQGKQILRTLLERRVPRALFERPKAGFAVPIGAWLRGPLREWAEPLLAESSLAASGLLDPAPIRRLWRAHGEGRRDHASPLWSVLMFQSWLADQR